MKTKLFLTVSALAVILMTKYCFTYTDVTAVSMAASIKKHTSALTVDKAVFHKKVYGIEDGILSSSAIKDTTLSSGALYYQYRPVICSNIFLDDVKIQLPLNVKTLDKKFVLSKSEKYSKNMNIADIMCNDNVAATVSYDDKGNIYKISCDGYDLKIDTIGVGSTIGQTIARWGQPQLSKNTQLHLYMPDDNTTISILTDGNGNITNISCGITDEMQKVRYGL